MSNLGPILVQACLLSQSSCLPVSCPLLLEIWRTCIWLWTLGTPDFSLSLPLTMLCGFGQIISSSVPQFPLLYKENTGLS